MRTAPKLLALLVPLILASCGELPSMAPTSDLPDVGPVASGECVRNGDGLYVCPPVTVGGGGECDPYTQDCGEGDCISSVDGEELTPQGCSGGGAGPIGGGGGDPGGGWTGGGGKGGTKVPVCPDYDPDCNSASEPDTCVTGDPLADDRAVELAFQQLWINSNPTAVQSQRVEQAAWVVQTSYGLKTVPWTNATFEPCKITPDVGTFSIPANAVAWIHTHPFTVGELQTSCDPISYDANGQPVYGTYNSFPNSEDIALAGLINQSLGRNIPSYTIDQSTIVRFVATGTTTATGYQPFPRCAY